MFRILRLVGDNLTAGPVTVRLPDVVRTPAGYRGAVDLDAARCLACGTCAYVCVSGAIVGNDEPGAYAWQYEPARCTFCGRCVDHCPGRALGMASVPLPAYCTPGELGVRRLVPFAPCTDCGRPVRPSTPDLLAKAFDHVTDEIRAMLRCCERCRRRRLQRRLVAATSMHGEPSGKEGR